MSFISPESCCPIPHGLREETMMFPSPIVSLAFEGAEAISVTHASTPAVEAVEPEGLIIDDAVTYCEIILRITFTKSERKIRQWLREISESTWSTDFKRSWEVDAQLMIADAGLGDPDLGDEDARIPTLHHAYHVLRGGVHYAILHVTC